MDSLYPPYCIPTSFLMLLVGVARGGDAIGLALILLGCTSCLHHSRRHTTYVHDPVRVADFAAIALFVAIVGRDPRLHVPTTCSLGLLAVAIVATTRLLDANVSHPRISCAAHAGIHLAVVAGVVGMLPPTASA